MAEIRNHIAADLRYQGLARKAQSLALADKLIAASPELVPVVESYVSRKTTTRELSQAVAAAYSKI